MSPLRSLAALVAAMDGFSSVSKLQPQEQQAGSGHPANTTSLMFTPHFQVDGFLPDVVLVSADNVTFHTHSQRLLDASTNAFGDTLTAYAFPRPIALPETSVVLNIVLHIIYGMSCVPYQPPFESTDAALVALIKYGVPAVTLARSQALFQLATSYAAHRPIDVYALAAHHGLEDIAIAVSPHLLAYDVSKLSHELTIEMGSVYFSRLCRLQ